MQFEIPVYDNLQLGCMVHGGGGEGSNGKHFSTIEGSGPGVCVHGRGGEMWKYFIAIEGMWKDFISI